MDAQTGLTVWLHDGYSEDDNTSGAIYVHEVTLQRDETGQGDWGPNLLTRGDPDTYKYVDQVGAARLDEVMRLSEQYGVYHKLTLFHKNDQVLGYLQADGSPTPDWDINNFYSQDGTVPRWLEKAYARYFVARWSYSTALHSLELGNENMLTTESYEAAYSVLGYIKVDRAAPYPAQQLVLGLLRGALLDQCAIRSADGLCRQALVCAACQAMASWSAPSIPTRRPTCANARSALPNIASQYAQNKPIVRGETGVWSGDNYRSNQSGQRRGHVLSQAGVGADGRSVRGRVVHRLSRYAQPVGRISALRTIPARRAADQRTLRRRGIDTGAIKITNSTGISARVGQGRCDRRTRPDVDRQCQRHVEACGRRAECDSGDGFAGDQQPAQWHVSSHVVQHGHRHDHHHHIHRYERQIDAERFGVGARCGGEV